MEEKNSNPINQRDIELLMNNPHRLVLELQKLIDIIISKFIRTGQFDASNFDEIKQQINEELLNKMPDIKNQFQEKSLLRTYLSVIIRNICINLWRKRDKIKYIDYEHVINIGTSYNTMDSMIIEEEKERLKKVMELYYQQKSKLILCLKLKFKMSFDFEDFREFNIHISQTEFEEFVHHIYPYEKCTDIILFTALTNIFNKYENKNNAHDTLRKWVNLKINELIDILNGNPPTSKYDEESFQILFEKCYYQNESVYEVV